MPVLAIVLPAARKTGTKPWLFPGSVQAGSRIVVAKRTSQRFYPAQAQQYPVKRCGIIVRLDTRRGSRLRARLIGGSLRKLSASRSSSRTGRVGPARSGMKWAYARARWLHAHADHASYSINPNLYALKFDAISDFTPCFALANAMNSRSF